MNPTSHTLTKEVTKTIRLNYLFYSPPNYDETADTKLPLVLFLHGAGERGDDPELLKPVALPQIAAHQAEFGFLLLAPQCPNNSNWAEQMDALEAFLDETVDLYPVDQTRIYLTGLSMGGGGAWYLAARQPDRFAALAPICGASMWWQGFPQRAATLSQLPIWTFHGDADSVVPIDITRQIVAVLEANGNDVRFTSYPGVGHNSWTQAYQNHALFEWFFEHELTPK